MCVRLTMKNKHVALWIEKHGQDYCDYALSKLKFPPDDIEELIETEEFIEVEELTKSVEKLAKKIVLDGKRTKDIRQKRDHLALSNFILFSGSLALFASLFMPIFFKNGSLVTSIFSALTIFISSVMSRNTLINLKDLEISEPQKCGIFATDDEISAVKKVLLERIDNYTDRTPKAYSEYEKRLHIKNLSKIVKITDDPNKSYSYNDIQDIKSIINRVFFDIYSPQEMKIHKQGKNLSRNVFIVGLFFICSFLLCEKAYKSSGLPELEESYVPKIVGGVGIFMATISLIRYLCDEVSLQLSKRKAKHWLSSPDAEKIIEKEVKSNIRVSSVTPMMEEEHFFSLHHRGHNKECNEEIFHIT